MKKLIKWFSIFAAAGTAIGLAVAYFCKNSSDSMKEKNSDLTEDEDFDLDADLRPAGEREYVSLKKEAPAPEEPKEEPQAPEEPAEKKQQAPSPDSVSEDASEKENE